MGLADIASKVGGGIEEERRPPPPAVGALSDIALTVGQGDLAQGEVADIIEFAESDWGLGLVGGDDHSELYPAQRVILKVFYGIPLDDTKKIVCVPIGPTPWIQDHKTYMTEAEYLRYLYDNGHSNIREVTPGQELRELVLAIGRRSGKCILGDSLVLTHNGIRRIEELGDPCGPEVQPLELEVAQEGPKRAVSKFFYNGGVKPTRTLTTHCGYQLGGTDNHRIKVLTEQGEIEWRYLADLKVGDVVCIHRNTNLWAREYVDCSPLHNTEGLKKLAFPSVLDERWGLLLGYLVGDGLWNYHDRVEITVEHPETWDHLKALYTDLLGSYYVCMDKRTANTGALKFSSVGMRKFLHDLGFRLGTDRDAKMVPWSVLQSPRPVVQAFLRGLFEADGGVEAGGKVVSFSSASGRLAREVQTLLLNLGIVSRVKPKLVGARVYWILSVQGLRSRTAFAERVGFDSRKKMEPLLASLKSATREGGTAESIPHQRAWATRLLQSVPAVQPRPHQKQAWSRSKLREALGNTIKPGSSEEMTYPRLAGVFPVAEELRADSHVVQHFKDLVALDYFFDPVEDIEEGQNPVYDLNVPDGESFVANGMTNHNTFLAAIVTAYETYKLLLKGSPQGYYGLSRYSQIGIVSVATDKDQAGILFQEASGHFASCAFFAPYTANNTLTYARFQTPADIDRFGRYKDDNTAKATLKITFKSCIAKGLRGPGNIIIILDELAHFNDVGQSDAEKVYEAITPSTATFSPKQLLSDGSVADSDGRVISISSPLGRQGFFYEKFQKGFKGGLESQDVLCIQAPTWEVNPTVSPRYFAKKYAKNPTSFYTEYGAEFTDRTRGWIERKSDLVACIDTRLRPKTQAPARMPHFMGIDLGLVGNGTAVAIGHIEGDQIVTDVVDEIKAGVGKFKDLARLEFTEVAEWVWAFSRRFYLIEGMFDQWAGIPFEQALLKKGLNQLKAVHMTRNLNSQIFQNFKDMIWDERVVLFDWPVPDEKDHCDYIRELLELQATYHSKYITLVEAPNIEGKFDDRSDALARMIWCASQHLGKGAYIARGAGKGSRITGVSSAAYRQSYTKSRRMGSSPDRQSRSKRRGR